MVTTCTKKINMNTYFEIHANKMLFTILCTNLFLYIILDNKNLKFNILLMA